MDIYLGILSLSALIAIMTIAHVASNLFYKLRHLIVNKLWLVASYKDGNMILLIACLLSFFYYLFDKKLSDDTWYFLDALNKFLWVLYAFVKCKLGRKQYLIICVTVTSLLICAFWQLLKVNTIDMFTLTQKEIILFFFTVPVVYYSFKKQCYNLVHGK
jgi:hypothetical protein